MGILYYHFTWFFYPLFFFFCFVLLLLYYAKQVTEVRWLNYARPWFMARRVLASRDFYNWNDEVFLIFFFNLQTRTDLFLSLWLQPPPPRFFFFKSSWLHLFANWQSLLSPMRHKITRYKMKGEKKFARKLLKSVLLAPKRTQRTLKGIRHLARQLFFAS